ncbi:hypothetical protein KUDE01_002213, partial [Dissostichus eleginoides]
IFLAVQRDEFTPTVGLLFLLVNAEPTPRHPILCIAFSLIVGVNFEQIHYSTASALWSITGPDYAQFTKLKPCIVNVEILRNKSPLQ